MISHLYGRDGFIWFTGVVEDRNDPERLGRVRVRLFSYHTEDKSKIPTNDLQWAHIIYPVTTPSMDGMGHTPSFLVEGSQVFGFFRDPDAFQEPMILGSIPGVASRSANSSKGFNDPNGIYPSITGEPDTNRLARGGLHQSEIEKANNSTTGVSSADGSTWDELEIENNAEYPRNHVFESESGHVVEFDDTNGSERIHEYHTSGTFYEIDADGNKVTRVVGDNYEIVAGSNYVNIKGNANLTVDGNFNLKVDKMILANDTTSLSKIFESIVTVLENIIKGSNWVGNMGSPLFYLKEPTDTVELQSLITKLKSLLKDYE
jgi:hypothetical protein